MKISENERKVLIIWVIIGFLIFLVVALVNIKPKIHENNENITTPGTNFINDRSRYYTVKNAINKFYSYKNIKDYESVIKILDENYVKENYIDEETITSYIGESNTYLTFDTGIMCLKNAKSGVYVFVVEGDEVGINTGKTYDHLYYEVTLDGNTSLFSIKPINEKEYGGVCNE